jgi:hypothetical protein
MERVTKMHRFFGMLLLGGLLFSGCHKKNSCPSFSDIGPTVGKNGQMKVSKPRSGLMDPKMTKPKKR